MAEQPVHQTRDFLWQMGPDNKPDVSSTVSYILKTLTAFAQNMDGLYQKCDALFADIDRIKADVDKLGMDVSHLTATPGSRGSERTAPNNNSRPPQPHQQDAPGYGADQFDDVKEFYYKDDTGQFRNATINVKDPICPLCNEQIGFPQKDKFGLPSLYCKSDRVYFNYSRNNPDHPDHNRNNRGRSGGGNNRGGGGRRGYSGNGRGGGGRW